VWSSLPPNRRLDDSQAAIETACKNRKEMVMKRLHALSLVCAFLLLGSTMSTALAGSSLSRNPSRQSRALQLVRDYLSVLNADMRTGEFSSLASVYARDSTLTMFRSLPRDTYYVEETGQVHGIAAIVRGYREVYQGFRGYRWIQVQVYYASDGRVVSYERVQGAPGRRVLRSETVATIHGGKIKQLDWTVDFGVHK
jgi:hypothetical protein